MKAAIGYVRVSTDGQAEDGVSLEAQQERIQAWCLVNGYQLAAVHVDAGLSGKRADNRPALNAWKPSSISVRTSVLPRGR